MNDNYYQWLDESTKGLVEELKDRLVNTIEFEKLSPIEKKFYVAWEIEMIRRYDEIPLYFYPMNQPYLSLIPQKEILINNKKYIVDFMVIIKNLKKWDEPETKDNVLIIELDSYLWHGSKPEQFVKEKERERILSKEGYKIIRFSGREIYKNVEECVDEAMCYCERICALTKEGKQ